VDRFGAGGRPLGTLPTMAGTRGGYAAMVVTVGADPGSVTALEAVRAVAGWEPAPPVVVVAHDVDLRAAYRAAGEWERAWGEQFPEGGPAPASGGDVVMAKEVIGRSTRYLAPDERGAALVRAEVSAALAGRVGVLPLAAPPVRPVAEVAEELMAVVAIIGGPPGGAASVTLCVI
jgi:hypothetical protein